MTSIEYSIQMGELIFQPKNGKISSLYGYIMGFRKKMNFYKNSFISKKLSCYMSIYFNFYLLYSLGLNYENTLYKGSALRNRNFDLRQHVIVRFLGFDPVIFDELAFFCKVSQLAIIIRLATITINLVIQFYSLLLTA